MAEMPLEVLLQLQPIACGRCAAFSDLQLARAPYRATLLRRARTLARSSGRMPVGALALPSISRSNIL